MKPIWVIEVRLIGQSDDKWSATGRDWYLTRKQCKQDISDITWQREMGYEYRAAKYTRKA